MNDRIDWGEGSFEFVTNRDLESMSVKQYCSNAPFVLCKYCLGENCEFIKNLAAQTSEAVYKTLFDESFDDENVLFSKISSIATEIKKSLLDSVDECAYMCAFVQLLLLVDEETCVDVTDELAKSLCAAFSALVKE